MNDEIIDKITSRLSELKNVDKQKNFNFLSINKNSSEKTFCFIDGSNFPVLKSNDICLEMIRVSAFYYKQNKKIKSEKKEFFVLVTFKDGLYETECFPLDYSIDNFKFNIRDEDLMTGKNDVEISRIGGCIRRISELKIAGESNAEIVVLDGSLDAKFSHEKKYLDEIYSRKIACGLSKTTDVLGNLDFSELIEQKGEWICEIPAKAYKAKTFFAKLNEKSEYIFRIDVAEDKIKILDEIISVLAENSKDIIFLGYPYALIEAHKIAKIDKSEKEYFLTKLMLKLGKDWKFFENKIKDSNAHEKLDKI